MADATLETMLLTGDRIAWVMKSQDRTCGITAIHRVYDGQKTYCSRNLPEKSRLFPPLSSLDICSRCETLYQRAAAHEQQQLPR